MIYNMKNDRQRRSFFVIDYITVCVFNSNTDNLLFDENFDAIAQAIASGILDTLEEADVIDENEYHVQVGLFRNWRNAQRLLNELLQQGFPAEIDDDGPFIQVRVGEYDSLEDAAVMERRLRRAGYDTLIVRN